MDNILIDTVYIEDINAAINAVLDVRKPVHTRASDNTDMLIMRTEDLHKAFAAYEFSKFIAQGIDALTADKVYTVAETFGRSTPPPMYRAVISSSARFDLFKIAYCGGDRKLSRKIMSSVHGGIAEIEATPLIGCDAGYPGVRKWSANRRYVIYYALDERERRVYALRIADGREDML